MERLEFLKFVLSRSQLALTETQTLLMWRALGEEAVTHETRDQLVYWLDGLVARENRTFTVMLSALAQESDPSVIYVPGSSSSGDDDAMRRLSQRPSKLACLAPGANKPTHSTGAASLLSGDGSGLNGQWFPILHYHPGPPPPPLLLLTASSSISTYTLSTGGSSSSSSSSSSGDYDFTAAASVLGGIGMGFIEAAAGGAGAGDMSTSGAFEEGILVKLFEGR